ncbi:hypothetical protein D3C77_608180 [compost metagenome]
MKIAAVGAWLVGIDVVHPTVLGIDERDRLRVMHIVCSRTCLIVVEISPACSRMLPHADGEILDPYLRNGFAYLIDARPISGFEHIPNRNVDRKRVGGRIDPRNFPVECRSH